MNIIILNLGMIRKTGTVPAGPLPFHLKYTGFRKKTRFSVALFPDMCYIIEKKF